MRPLMCARRLEGLLQGLACIPGPGLPECTVLLGRGRGESQSPDLGSRGGRHRRPGACQPAQTRRPRESTLGLTQQEEAFWVPLFSRRETEAQAKEGQAVSQETVNKAQLPLSTPQSPAPRCPVVQVPSHPRAPPTRQSPAGPSRASSPACQSWSSPRLPPSSPLRSPSRRPPRPCSRPKAASRRRPSRS